MDEISEPIEPDPEVYLQYADDPAFRKKSIAYKFSRADSMYMYIGYNEKQPMFKDKQTRQALTMLIDRKYIIDEYLKGFGSEMARPIAHHKEAMRYHASAAPLRSGWGQETVGRGGMEGRG